MGGPDRVSSAAERDPLPHTLPQRSSRPPQTAPQSIPDQLDLPRELSQSPSRPSQSAPQRTPDHFDLPRIQKPLFCELFFNNMRFRRGETAVWDNRRIGCHRLQHGTPLPHAPGARMTVVKTKLPQIMSNSKWALVLIDVITILPNSK